MTDATRWSRVSEIFQDALGRDDGTRATYLDAACAGDAALRAEVESLLAAHQAAGDFANGSPIEALPSSAVSALATPLVPGARLGPYEIVAPLDAGGMGALFRARDVRLGREVAVKVPLVAAGSDPIGRERFQREARAIAALTHPHICTVHDVGFESGVDYLVLELLQGESLASRLKRGPMPVDEALARAIEIAGALSQAHRAGIVHRDLKPGNVMLTPSGAKVLDFGLARITRGWSDRPMGPAATITASLTEAAAVLGTLPYMAPEQVEGRVADAPADIFAFGATLYEMLTGKRAFDAPSSPGLMAAILRGESPSLLELQPAFPPALDRIVRTCLQKDPEARFASMRDLAMNLQWVRHDQARGTGSDSPAPVASAARRSWMTIAVAGLTATALGVLMGWVARQPQTSAPSPMMRFEVIPSPVDPINVGTTTPTLAMSRDGRRLAYASGSASSGGPLVIREIGELMPRRVESAPEARDPFFSPDGQWVGYYGGSSGLRKIPVTGGTPVEIVAGGASFRGASWDEDGTIVYATTDPNDGLFRVSDAGGTPIVLTTPNKDLGEADHVLPFVLPDGRGILFTILDGAADNPRVAVFDPRDRSQRVVIPGAASAQYVNSGHIVYAAAGTLFAVRFNLDELRVEGEPQTVANGVLMATAAGAYYAASPTGSLAYVPATATPDPPRTLVWVDRRGAEIPVNAPARAYRTVRLAPDGQRIAVEINDQQRDVWIWDMRRRILTPITDNRREDQMPIWTPDGERLVFQSRRDGAGGNLYLQAADGSGAAEPLTTGPATFVASSITSDGATLLGNSSLPKAWTLFVKPLGKRAPATPLLLSPSSQNYPAASPNMRFIAYQSNESGRTEIWVRPFPNVNDRRWQVSTEGGTHPVWARNGRELFFLNSSRALMSAPVDSTGTEFRGGVPVRVLPASSYYYSELPAPYDVGPDETRFLMIKEDPAVRAPNTPIVMLLNALAPLATWGAGR